MKTIDFAPIPDGARANLETIIRAAKNDDLGLVSAKDAKTGEQRYVIAAFALDEEGMVNVTPFAALSEDPYAEFVPVLQADDAEPTVN